ncbi:zinc ribbon domain-containing protein [Aeromonas veronii]|uniref:double zinc ribbon domain-containing protein n=1 Tax=Aeromonas veronii TaxID=654 RepID=UPI00191D87EB|nr:zinc ribbon domain-containing protein [Aeromonas veronii]
MGSCAAPSAKGDDKFITTDYLQQCPRFCQQCGTSLVPSACAQCGTTLQPGAKFCAQCGKAAV